MTSKMSQHPERFPRLYLARATLLGHILRLANTCQGDTANKAANSEYGIRRAAVTSSLTCCIGSSSMEDDIGRACSLGITLRLRSGRVEGTLPGCW